MWYRLWNQTVLGANPGSATYLQSDLKDLLNLSKPQLSHWKKKMILVLTLKGSCETYMK